MIQIKRRMTQGCGHRSNQTNPTFPPFSHSLFLQISGKQFIPWLLPTRTATRGPGSLVETKGQIEKIMHYIKFFLQ